MTQENQETQEKQEKKKEKKTVIVGKMNIASSMFSSALDASKNTAIKVFSFGICYCSLILTTNCSLNLSNSYC